MSRRSFMAIGGTLLATASALVGWTARGARGSVQTRGAAIWHQQPITSYVDRDGWMLSPADVEHLATGRPDTP